VGRDSGYPIFDGADVFTPDDVMAGRVPEKGPVIVWDDDHYYMGGVLAELCRAKGLDVTIVTPAAMVSAWTVNTLEALPIARRIAKLGIAVIPYISVTAFAGGTATLVNNLTGAASEIPAESLVTVTARLPVDDLFDQLRDRWQDAGIVSLARIGDCLAPSTIQQAVYTGHKWARELDEEPEVLIPRELPMIESGRLKATP
jgi:dimethylamine/trimethylamine dehydrogenase